MTTPKQLSRYGAVDLLAGLSPSELEQVARRIRERQWPAGHDVVSHRDDSRDVYFVLDGKVRVTLFSERGKEISFRELEAGQSFGELSAIDGQPRSADVVALKDAVLGSVTAGEFMELMRRYPPVAEAALRKLAALVRSLSQRIYESSEKGPVRICNELVRLARASMVDGGRAARIRPRPRDADVASRVGSHREAVSRLISELDRNGLLVRGRGELLVRDVPALAAYAHRLHEQE